LAVNNRLVPEGKALIWQDLCNKIAATQFFACVIGHGCGECGLKSFARWQATRAATVCACDISSRVGRRFALSNLEKRKEIGSKSLAARSPQRSRSAAARCSAFLLDSLEGRLLLSSQVLGLDVSGFQGTVEWNQVAGAGKSFAFVKATEGMNTNDADFGPDVIGCLDNEITVGAYHLGHPDDYPTTTDAASEAQHFVDYVNSQGSEYGFDYFTAGNLRPVLDIEYNDADDPSGSYGDLSAWCLAWLNEVYNLTGVKGIIYTTQSYASELTGLSNFPLWVADPDGSATVVPSTGNWSTWAVKQYTGDPPNPTGSCPGVTGNVDLDVLNSGSTTLGNLEIGQAGSTPTISSVSPNPVTGSNNAQTLTISGSGFAAGDTVSFTTNSPYGTGATVNANIMSSTELTATYDFGTDPAQWNAQVLSSAGDSNAVGFSVDAPTPTISSTDTPSTPAGSPFTLTVYGTDFDHVSYIDFNGSRLTTSLIIAGGIVNGLSANVPASDVASSGNYPVTAVTPPPGGGTSNSLTVTATSTENVASQLVFGVEPSDVALDAFITPPIVVQIEDSSGNTVTRDDSDVTLSIASGSSGASLSGTLTVPADNGVATFSNISLNATGTYTLTATDTSDNLATISAAFTVSSPTISSISPDPVIGSYDPQTITITGSNFASGQQVILTETSPYQNQEYLTPTILSSTELQVSNIFGNDPGTWTAQIYYFVGDNDLESAPVSFSVNAPFPVITSIGPSSAPVGGSGVPLTVNGTTFEDASIIEFDGSPLYTSPEYDENGHIFALTAIVPASAVETAGEYPVTVISTGPGGGTSAAVNFNVTPSVTAPALGVSENDQGIANGQSTPINFGSVAQGQPGPSVTFDIDDTGTATLTVGPVSVPAGYTLAFAPATSVATGGSTSFVITLDSSTVGLAAGDITFDTNDPNNTTFSFPVTGTVTVPLAGTLYVDSKASGNNNGSSWANAFVSLQSALSAATSGDTIEVAQGTYYPTTGTDRTATFQLLDGVAIHGGYAPGGSAEPNPATYPTILSGDIGILGDNSDNSYHVVTGSGTDSTAVLDGFTITGGNADGTFQPGGGGIGGGDQIVGAGMLNVSGDPTVENCIFTNNAAGLDTTGDGGGAGMFNYYSSPTVTNCVFSNNTAGYGIFGAGGGVLNAYSSPTLIGCEFISNIAFDNGGGLDDDAGCSPTLINCTFNNNSSPGQYGAGGGIENDGSDLVLINCDFTRNASTNSGGAVANNYSSSTTLTNCVLWGNLTEIDNDDSAAATTVANSDIEGGYAGSGNINADPLFVDAANNNLQLQDNSPCINVGSNAALPANVTTDLAGIPRIINGTVDMGAYECVPGLAVTSGAVYTFSESSGGQGTLFISAGSVTLTSDISASLGSYILSIGDDASVMLASSQNIGGIQLTGSGILDLGIYSVIVNYGADNPSPMSTIYRYVASGYNGGAWNGTGIVSSAAAANPTAYTLGYADGDNPIDAANTGVPAGEIKIMYTVAGDANLSGGVDLSDLVIVASDFGKSGADWAEGDVNYDGNVDLSDLVIVASNFGASLAQEAGTSSIIAGAADPVDAAADAPTVSASPAWPVVVPTIAPAIAPTPVPIVGQVEMQLPLSVHVKTLRKPMPAKSNDVVLVSKPVRPADIGFVIASASADAQPNTSDDTVAGVWTAISQPANPLFSSEKRIGGTKALLD
jgi:GH25 family lysozyme M1 (1,4-beta-N-acetylmuramidase)